MVLTKTPHLEISKNESKYYIQNYYHIVQVHKREGEDTECISITVIFFSSLGFLSREDSQWYYYNWFCLWNISTVVLWGNGKIYPGDIFSCYYFVSAV